jgi:betaine lipid synthase
MDSMDWFDPTTDAALVQVRALHKVMKDGGRVLFRSAALRPWYTRVFEENGFLCRCVGKRVAGACIDRYHGRFTVVVLQH